MATLLLHRILAVGVARRTSASSITSSWYSVARCTISMTAPAVVTAHAYGFGPICADNTVNSGRNRLPPAVNRCINESVITSSALRSSVSMSCSIRATPSRTAAANTASPKSTPANHTGERGDQSLHGRRGGRGRRTSGVRGGRLGGAGRPRRARHRLGRLPARQGRRAWADTARGRRAGTAGAGRLAGYPHPAPWTADERIRRRTGGGLARPVVPVDWQRGGPPRVGRPNPQSRRGFRSAHAAGN